MEFPQPLYHINELRVLFWSLLVGKQQHQNIHIFVSNTTMDSSNGSFIYSGNTTSGLLFTLRQNLPKSFRYLMIKRFTQSILTICEVQVFEAGKFFTIIT